jgi:hypothetical protein
MPFYSIKQGCLKLDQAKGCSKAATKQIIGACIALTCFYLQANAASVTNSAGLSITLNPDGNYAVQSALPAWTFGGGIGRPVKKAAPGSGSDSLGQYQRVSFEWMDGLSPMGGEIRLYNDQPLVLFSESCRTAVKSPPAPFPDFKKLPADLHLFSYRQEPFAPPQFAANDCSTPWLLFDDEANAMVISPAAHFMVASMIGDGKSRVASGFNQKLTNLPAGFSLQTLLAFGHGINRTWDLWGQSLRRWEGVKALHNDADAILKYLGYWTDNGAFYYYNFDVSKGYSGSLELLVAYYRQEAIPIRYLQLDSWWYYKTTSGVDDQTVNGKKNPESKKNPGMPDGEWNRYGGLSEYKAHPYVFPMGLEAFQKSIGLPLITHNRWIAPESPYHQNYEISGLAAVDPKWWNDVADYLHNAGVQTYEQDWLYSIYQHSPAFSSDPGMAERFLDNMARACNERGMTVQYCMPYPCYFLQGSRYDNLTTIRTSSDRFGRNHWPSFLYTSRFAYSMGIRPWSDVFNSAETNNLLLSTLSSGPVGIGDAMGLEDKENLFKVVRADGVIVKPDEPALPMDCSYLAAAHENRSPMLAAAFSDHGDVKTAYLFAFNQVTSETNEVRISPADLGFAGPVYAYNYFAGTGRRLEAGQNLSVLLNQKAVGYYIITSIGKSGTAFLGDAGKLVSNGKQRIASLKDKEGEMSIGVRFSPTEKTVTLHGYSATAPNVSVTAGEAGPVKFNADTGQFAFEVHADLGIQPDKTQADPTRYITVVLTNQPNKLTAKLGDGFGH